MTFEFDFKRDLWKLLLAILLLGSAGVAVGYALGLLLF